eukprot:12421260-Karenia_brevis.AAC.1
MNRLSQGLRQGSRICVNYRDDRSLWHERVVLCSGGGTRWYLLTPDLEITEEDLNTSGADSDICRMRLLKDGRLIGVAKANLYLFSDSSGADLTEAQLQEYVEEAEMIVATSRGVVPAEKGDGPAAPPGAPAQDAAAS